MGTASYYLVWTLFGVSFTCINLYLLISSYFLTESRFSLWKLVKMAVQVLFYALGITAIYWIFTDVPHDLEYLVYSILPISSDFYWFVSMYVGMYVLAPVMNKLILALTKRQLACACALALALVSVWPNIFYFSSADCSIEEGRVEAAGRKIHKNKMSIAEQSFMSLCRDPEGNMFGLNR